jgi:hypothetical protein
MNRRSGLAPAVQLLLPKFCYSCSGVALGEAVGSVVEPSSVAWRCDFLVEPEGLPVVSSLDSPVRSSVAPSVWRRDDGVAVALVRPDGDSPRVAAGDSPRVALRVGLAVAAGEPVAAGLAAGDAPIAGEPVAIGDAAAPGEAVAVVDAAPVAVVPVVDVVPETPVVAPTPTPAPADTP